VRLPKLLEVFVILLLLASPSAAARFDCGQPKSTGSKPTTTDAVVVLKESVGLATDCDEKPCVCDVNGSGKIDISDALRTLKVAVGQNVSLACNCFVSSSSTSTTEQSAACPISDPIPDLREDCSHYVYVYSNATEAAGLNTDGVNATVRLVDLVNPNADEVRLSGPVTGQRTVELDTACIVDGPCTPVVASASISISGQTLFVVRDGETYSYTYEGTGVLSESATLARLIRQRVASSGSAFAAQTDAGLAASSRKSFLAAWKAHAGK
jgi:hypothetical protein